MFNACRVFSGVKVLSIKFKCYTISQNVTVSNANLDLAQKDMQLRSNVFARSKTVDFMNAVALGAYIIIIMKHCFCKILQKTFRI